MQKRGFVRGDVLTIYLPTCPQALVAFYACSKLGVIANIVHPLTSLSQLKEIVQTVSSKGLMYFDVLCGNGQALADICPVLIHCSACDYWRVRKGFYKLYALAKFGAKKAGIPYIQCLEEQEKYPETMAAGDDVVCTMHSGGTSGEHEPTSATFRERGCKLRLRMWFSIKHT